MTPSRPRAASPPTTKPVGLKDIARELGVSIGTVARALNGKGEVSRTTRARVVAAAQRLAYQPNLAARSLQSGRRFRVAVHLPGRVALFWDALREGIREAAAPFASTLDVEFETYRRLGDGDIPLLERALADEVDGLIISPGNPAALAPLLEEAASRGIPVACVVTDAPDSPRLLSVSADPFTVGAVAGELLGRFVSTGGEVAFFTGWLATQDHAEKFRGFVSSLSRINPGLKLGPIVEAHDDEAEADRRTREVLRAHPRLKALYISTSNSMPVLRAAARMGRLSGLTVVTTDLFPELAEMIRTGEVAATVYQRPLSQGRIALQALYQFLHGGRTPAAHQRVAPHLVMSSNLDLVLERLAGHPAAAAGDQSPPSLNVTPTVARQKLKSDSPRSSRSTSSSSPGSSSWSERK